MFVPLRVVRDRARILAHACLVLALGCGAARQAPDGAAMTPDGGEDGSDASQVADGGVDAAHDAPFDAPPDVPEFVEDARVPVKDELEDVYGFADEPREHAGPLSGLALAVSSDRVLFGDILGARALSVTLTAIEAEALVVRDRRTLDVHTERFLGGADWTDRFTTFFVPLDAQRVVVVASRQRIELLSLEGDTIASRAQLALHPASNSILAGAGRGDRLFTCAGFSLTPYHVTDDAIVPEPAIGLSGSCRGLSLSPDGGTLYVATTVGFHAADVRGAAPVLGDAYMTSKGFYRVEATGRVLVAHTLRNFGELGEIAVYDANDATTPSPTPLARFVPDDTPAFVRPIGFALTNDRLFVEWYRFSSGEHRYDVDVHTIDDTPAVSGLVTRARVRQTAESGAFVSPMTLTAHGDTVVLDPWRHVLVLGGDDRLTRVRGVGEGTLERLWSSPGATLSVAPLGAHSLALASSPPEIAGTTPLGPETDRLRIAATQSGESMLVTLPLRGRSNVRTHEPVTRITCLDAAGGALTSIGTRALDGGPSTLASIPGVLYQMPEAEDGRYVIRRFALDAPCNGTTMTPSGELTIDLGAPATAPSGWALAVDSVTGDVLAADMIYDTSTATTRIRLGWWDARTGRVAAGEVVGTTSQLEALVIHHGRAILLENGRALRRIERDGDVVVPRVHVALDMLTPSAVATRVLAFDGSVVYLSLMGAPYGVLAVRAEDLAVLARYEAPSPIDSVAFFPDAFVMAAANVIRVARQPLGDDDDARGAAPR